MTAAPANHDLERRRSRTTVDLLRHLVEVEARFPVHTWMVGDLHVWPLVRYDLCSRNHFLAGRREADGPRTPLQTAVKRIGALARGGARWAAARVSDRDSEDRVRPADVLFYSDGASWVRMGAHWVDRFCDPLVDAAREMGLSTLLLTPAPLTQYYVPRRTPSILVQPWIDAHAQVAAVRARVAPHAPPQKLDGYEDFISFVRREIPDAVVCSRDQVRRMAVYVRTFATMYRRMLRRISPRAVFVVCYYGAERMAMCVAARELGIPSVDVQHGSATGHWAYAKWSRLPPEGYEMLPTFFWCWDRETVGVIEDWSREHARWHRGILGGNPFLAQWMGEARSAFVREHDERMRTLVERGGRREQVLLTTNGYETPDQIRKLAELVRDTGDRFFWWVRMHPCFLETSGAFERALREVGATSWRVREATDVPLYGLLRFMDLHVTELSSTVIEAAEFGIPSVLMSADEAGFYASLVRDGWVLPVDGIEDVPRGLALQRERRGALRATKQSRADSLTRPALQEILEARLQDRGAPGIS